MNNTVNFIGVDDCPQNYIRCGTTLNLTMAVFGTSWNFSNHSVSHLEAVGYDAGSSHCREGTGKQFWDFTFAMELIRRQSWCWAPELRCGGHISRGSAPDYPNSTNHTNLPSHTKHLELEENAMRKIEQRRKKVWHEEKWRKIGGGYFVTGWPARRQLEGWTRPAEPPVPAEKWTRPLTPAPDCRRQL